MGAHMLWVKHIDISSFSQDRKQLFSPMCVILPIGNNVDQLV